MKNEEELAWISELVKEAMLQKQFKEAADSPSVRALIQNGEPLEKVMEEIQRVFEKNQQDARDPPN